MILSDLAGCGDGVLLEARGGTARVSPPLRCRKQQRFRALGLTGAETSSASVSRMSQCGGERNGSFRGGGWQ